MSEVQATIDILESYHRNGGFFEIPTGVISDVEGVLEEQEKEIKRLNNIINELEKEMQKEIERTEKLIQDDYEHGLGSFGTIRKMLNEERKNWLYKIKKLKGDGSNE